MAHFQIKLFTQQKQFSVTDNTFSVPGSSTCTELNDLVNKLLSEDKDESTRSDFDFLVNDEFIRTSLVDHVETKGLSSESVIDVEYLQRKQAPELQHSFQQPDWISSIKTTEKFILTGSYDCAVTVWDRVTTKQLVCGIGHSEPVKSIELINYNADEKKQKISFVSTSQDQHAVIWTYNSSTNQLSSLFCCKGHSKSVECAASNEKKSIFATGSWDSTIKVWSSSVTPEEDTQEVINSSKKKFKSGKKSLTRTAKVTLPGHTEVVSALTWLNENEICSGSWDHTIRIWDIDTAVEKSHMRGMKSILSLDYSHLSRLVVTGNTDRHVRLWDPRSGEGAVVKCNLTSHIGWVTSVHWAPNDSHTLVSGSLDNCVKMWDTRSPKAPLYDLQAHTDKVMSVDWSLPDIVASGGADCKVFTFAVNTGAVDNVYG
ncbi:ribosome biogenesis protein wdr12-like [Ciona intestinalis]